MIVVVETNFILELVLQQEESPACEELVALCSGPHARMIIPAFAIAEAGAKLEHDTRERRNFLQQDLADQVRKISRARALGRLDTMLLDFDAEMVRAERDVKSRWLDFRVSLDRVELIPMTAAVLEETIAIQVGKEIDTLQDAIIFASVKKYLEGARAAGETERACFISRDVKAFAADAVIRQLRKLDCTTKVKSFADAAKFVQHSIKQS